MSSSTEHSNLAKIRPLLIETPEQINNMNAINEIANGNNKKDLNNSFNIFNKNIMDIKKNFEKNTKIHQKKCIEIFGNVANKIENDAKEALSLTAKLQVLKHHQRHSLNNVQKDYEESEAVLRQTHDKQLKLLNYEKELMERVIQPLHKRLKRDHI